MTRLFLYDDATARLFEPFALTRPVSELRAGTEYIRKRWEVAARAEATGSICAAHLEAFTEGDAPPVLDSGFVIPAGSIVANSRFVAALSAQFTGDIAISVGKVCAVRVRRDLRVADFMDGELPLEKFADGDSQEIAGRWLHAVWDLIGSLAEQLTEDISALAKTLTVKAHFDNVAGDSAVAVEDGARIDPLVAFDTSAGPVLIRRGASVASFSKLIGPLYIGEHATVMGDSISTSSIGEWCKVRGEMSNTIMLGHCNKGHTGFVGHSYLGRWVNLGSGTTTSNLKNTYGTVQIWTPGGIVDTGLQFLGTLFGDHAKTGIGMMLTTGSVIGAGANIFGTTMPPKMIPPFSWGDSEPYAIFEEEKFLDVASRVMARRHVELDERGKRHLRSCHSKRWS